MFNGKNVIITGGSSGLGKALAERLIKRGGNLALIARDEKKLLSVKTDLLKSAQAGGKVEIY